MTEQEVYSALNDKAAKGYKINEIIPFSYPVRRLIMDVVVNKQPDSSLLKVYTVLLRAIRMGMHQADELFAFLGISTTDEFMLRELFSLREKGYLDLVSDQWFITAEGELFIQNNEVLRVEEKEEYEFLIDGLSGEVWSKEDWKTGRQKLAKSVQPRVTALHKSTDLLKGKYQPLADVFKKDHQQKAYLLGYEEDEIKKDFEEYIHLWLIEYVPVKKTDTVSFLEVRNFQDLQKNKPLTERFNAEYKEMVYGLTTSERSQSEAIIPSISSQPAPQAESNQAGFDTLTIWETKQQFVKALQEVKQRVLIESPWIKRATQEYLPLFEQLLKDGKQLIILYGIGEHDEHDYPTLKKVEELQRRYDKQFLLLHLPSYFWEKGSRLTGTHRKLMIKDNDYYISGSFNFLSFGKNENQQVANEESTLFRQQVPQRWAKLIAEYQLENII
ncbi:MAG: hypothetical protein RIS29_708 [Bacteroidota bacterium]|jgi:hypothetical protein